MSSSEALGRLKVQTGSLVCLGYGYEHNWRRAWLRDHTRGRGAAEPV
ncbi:MAG: hypothetical protein ACLR4Z_01335 [Butyricicoccaceae bacterium]